jgi:PAS domain S-box-containing protein
MKPETDRLLIQQSGIQHILDALPFCVLLVDSNRSILAANATAARELGLEPEQLVGAHCPEIIHGCEGPIANCPLSVTLQNGQAAEREVFDSRSQRWLNAAVYPTPFRTADGRAIYLHFGRDITETRRTARELSRSLEHHRALANLLQKLQYCRDSTQMLEVLIDEVISLSWLGMTATGIGFLVSEHGLQMSVHRNAAPHHLKSCRNLKFGECCCGKVAKTGRLLVCPSATSDHTIKFNGMGEHQHVIVPISHEGRLLAVYNLYLNPDDQIDETRLGFLEAAASATAVALSAQLAREDAKRTQERYMAQLISSQEDERKSVARDLHDHVCQSLSAILLEMQVRATEDDKLKHIRDSFEARIHDLIDEVRKMAGRLRPTILDDYGLESALSRLLKELSAHTELKIDYQFIASPDQSGRRLPPPIELALYRIAVDALNNVLSHAAASRVSVIVVRQKERVMLLVEDDGCGFDYPAVRKNVNRCLGLIGMEERITLMGGSLTIESTPNKGTTVRAEIGLELPNDACEKDSSPSTCAKVSDSQSTL